MSIRYVKSNSEGARDLFNKRVIYYKEASFPQTPGTTTQPKISLVDFVSEKFLFGRVNRTFVPISINKHYLRPIPSTHTAATNMRAIHFVVDAFKALVQQFEKCGMEGKISIDDPFLSQLKAYRAFEDPNIKYQQYMKRYMALLKANINSEPNNQIENYGQFETKLIESAQLTGLSSPITYTGFIKSRRCPITVSGLVIEIADLNASDDEEKVAQFLQSKNWDFFVNAAATYGFMIDKAVPWRLVADIGSSAMLQYASAYGINTTDQVIERCFTRVGAKTARDFSNLMYNMYNKTKPSVIVYSEHCNGKTTMKQKTPAAYSSSKSLVKINGSEHFYRLYCKFRFYEEESKYTENEQRMLINDLVLMIKGRGIINGIRKFERILNKPFDYVGSFNYNINSNRMTQERQENALDAVRTIDTYGQIPQER